MIGKKERMINLPNTLTILRIILVPLLFLLLYKNQRIAFFIIYALAGSTDFFDGLLARKLNQMTHFGKTLDSIADLVFYISTAAFSYILFPHIITNNWTLILLFFLVLILSFIISLILIGKPKLLHTIVLKFNAVLVYFTFILSFFFDTTMLVKIILIIYYIGFAEEILIFIFYRDVDADTKSLLSLIKKKKE
jgi:CDP-diacylglycerol--glycerol-3-phosphate 3-phosphatidyltransferase